MKGHLIARSLRVQQYRVRESQRYVDTCGSVMRRLKSIHRCDYCVSGPLALWHIDGNHKLIMYIVQVHNKVISYVVMCIFVAI